MSRTVIDLDDEARKTPPRSSAGTTKRATVNTALRKVTARYRRRRALGEARELAAEGALDIDILLDKSKYRPTSRQDGVHDAEADA